MGPTPGFAAGWSFGKVHSLGPFLGTGTLHLLPVMSTPTSDPSIAGRPLGGVGGWGGQFSVQASSRNPSARVQRRGLDTFGPDSSNAGPCAWER